MSISPGLSRLLRIRRLEEEQQAQAFSQELADLRAVEKALSKLAGRMRQERHSIAELVVDDDRLGIAASRADLGNMEECAKILNTWITLLKQRTDQSRSLLLAKQTERKKAECMVRRIAQSAEMIDNRHAQQAADQWHLERAARTNRTKGAEVDVSGTSGALWNLCREAFQKRGRVV